MTPRRTGDVYQAASDVLRLDDENIGSDEIQEILDRIEDSPENQTAFQCVERFLEACESVNSDAASRSALALEGISDKGYSLPRWLPPLAIAASVALALIGVGSIFVTDQNRKSDAPVLAEMEYTTGVGKQREIRLPDGSQLLLGGRSAVSVSFSSDARRIALVEGEALFTVVRDPKRPFIVETESGSATAIGTEFNVHRSNGGATVTVTHGIVAVETRGLQHPQHVLLGASTQVAYSSEGNMGEKRWVDLQSVLAWRHGQLNFVRRPLADVVADLNRYSAKQIIIGESGVGTIPVTGTVDASGISDWLKGLASVTGIRLIEESQSITLRRMPPPNI